MNSDTLNDRNLERRILFPPAGPHLTYGTFAGPLVPFDNLDANIPLLEFGINDQELNWLGELFKLKNPCKIKYKPIEEVVKGIMEAETPIELDNYDLRVSASGARQAIIDSLTQLVSTDRPLVAYASPNWSFDIITSHVPGASRNPFFAFDENSFVSGFSQLPNKNKIAAVILVDPANPLGYRFGRKHIQEIERIAKQNGIVPIFDDAFRGLQAPGERHSSSEYSNNSIIVETTSKRFGIKGIGVTWTLTPKTLNLPSLPSIRNECEGCSGTASLITDALYSTGYDTRIRSRLVTATDALIRGAADGFENFKDPGSFTKGFEGMPIIIYHLPNLAYKNFEGTLERISNEIGVTSGLNWMCDYEKRTATNQISQEEVIHALSYMRICPTKENPARLYVAGRKLAEIIKTSEK